MRFLPLIRLYFISWWRGFVGPFLSLGLAPLLLLMLGQLVPYNTVAPSFVIYCTVTLGVQTFPVSLTQFRNSSIVKRISQTPITRTDFIVSIFLFNLVLIFLSSVFLIIIMFLYQELNIVKTSIDITKKVLINGKLVSNIINIKSGILWENVQWFWVTVIWLVSTIFSIAIGFLIGTLVKSTERANGVGLTIYMISNFLGGIFFPLRMMRKALALEYTSLGNPYRYLSSAINLSFNGDMSASAPFEITKSLLNGEIYTIWEIGPIFFWILIPLVLGICFLLLSARFFKWE